MDSKTIITNTLSNKINSVISLCITIIFSNLFLVLSPFFLGCIIDNLVNTMEVNLEKILFFAILACVTLILRLLCEYIELKQIYNLCNHITTALQKEAYSSIMKADCNDVSKITSINLSDLIGKDCVTIGKEYVGNNIVKFTNNLTYLIIVSVTMLITSPIVGAIILVCIPLFHFSIVGMRKLFKKNQAEVDYLKFEESKLIEENFALLRDIKVRNGVEKEIKDYRTWLENNDKKFKHNYELIKLSGGLIKTIIISIVMILVVSLGVYLSINSIADTSLGNVLACAIYVPFIYGSVLKVMDTKISVNTIAKEINNLNLVYRLRSEQRSEPITQLDELSTIRFNNVCYDDGESFVSDLTFEVKNNEKLGILCLENTSTNLIHELFIKMRKPRSGSVLYNNCDFSKINTFYLRNLVSSVSDINGLFDDTIINNIIYPFPFDEYKYNDSLYKVKLKDIIFDLENKDQTLVNDLNSEIRQQIAIANAFYKDSKVFIFNNATKNLNHQLSEEIQKEIFKLKNKFIVMITEKGHDVTNCDKVVILKNGEVVESGEVSQLMKDKNSVLYSSVRRIRVRNRIVS